MGFNLFLFPAGGLAPFGGRFAFALVTRFLVMFAPPRLGQNAGLLHLAVEPLEQTIETFSLAAYNLCQIESTSFREELG